MKRCALFAALGHQESETLPVQSDVNMQDSEEKKKIEDCIVDVTEEEYKRRINTLEYPPLPTVMIEILRKRYEKVKKREVIEQRAKVIRSRTDVFSKGDDNEVCQGDIRLKKVFWLLNNMGYTRSPDQVVFHHAYIMACLPLIYREDWPKHSVRVMKMFKLKKLDQLVLVLTPRRIGKTVSVAMFVTALLLCVPGLTIAVFSTCQRASTAIMKLVAKIMSGIEGSDLRVLTHNKEQLMIGEKPLPMGVGPNSAVAKKMANSPNVSVLNCFPASENSKSNFSWRQYSTERSLVRMSPQQCVCLLL
jgi:hypothetical protein